MGSKLIKRSRLMMAVSGLSLAFIASTGLAADIGSLPPLKTDLLKAVYKGAFHAPVIVRWYRFFVMVNQYDLSVWCMKCTLPGRSLIRQMTLVINRQQQSRYSPAYVS